VMLTCTRDGDKAWIPNSSRQCKDNAQGLYNPLLIWTLRHTLQARLGMALQHSSEIGGGAP